MRILLWCVAVLLLLLMLLSGAGFLHGSLELFPTEEQQRQVRWVYGVAFVGFATLELLVAMGLWRERRVIRAVRR
ncbi:hypothetical protein KUV74_14280 [Halomonas sp. DP1Y21-3]|uniref:hypothetical protein n=1 Tax=Halomonas sp. DP1Y21-3 TaxID=2859080 RepID=UPI001C93F657|nr:hypothetical protein [Halomonas sp. DP1Y21-3]MBY6111564.1 hypothetical protein [Halomonas sp. DP1Y21-3]